MARHDDRTTSATDFLARKFRWGSVRVRFERPRNSIRTFVSPGKGGRMVARMMESVERCV